MRVDASRGKLYDAQKTIRARWEDTLNIWRDMNQKEFEEHIWLPMDQQTAEVLRAIDQLGRIFGQVRQECLGERNE
jgi:hypothetical protein